MIWAFSEREAMLRDIVNDAHARMIALRSEVIDSLVDRLSLEIYFGWRS